MTFLVLLQVTGSPDQCFLTGICGVGGDKPAVAPGVLFVAVGLIVFGAIGLRRSGRFPSS